MKKTWILMVLLLALLVTGCEGLGARKSPYSASEDGSTPEFAKLETQVADHFDIHRLSVVDGDLTTAYKFLSHRYKLVHAPTFDVYNEAYKANMVEIIDMHRNVKVIQVVVDKNKRQATVMIHRSRGVAPGNFSLQMVYELDGDGNGRWKIDSIPWRT